MIVLLLVTAGLGGCTSPAEFVQNGFKVGPNFQPPPAPVAANWIDAADKRVRSEPDDLSKWWTVFHDPVLDQLICHAYRQNLTLREAGFRVLQARAQLGIAAGNLLPQTQFGRADFTWLAESAQVSRGPVGSRFTSRWDAGFNLSWELDFWGRLRRAVESANDNLDASVNDYDDVLVTLLSDVATNYVQMRVTEQRIKYARENVKLQEKTWKIALARIKIDADGELSASQSEALLKQTAAAIYELEISQRLSANQLCILLGIPPEDLATRLGTGPIPTAPPEVGLGIPANLLRRRPDIRRAESFAASQCAQIGIAEAEFYPQISLVGTLGYSAAQFKDLFRSSAFNGAFGPSLQWNILNYGRLLNNVRFQDAKFQELVAHYQETVLTAQQEVENGLVTFLKAQQRTKLQAESAAAADKGEKLVAGRYENGLENFTRVTQLQQLLVQEQDILAQAQGEIALGLIQVYKALGGGWEIRCTGCEADLPEQLKAPQAAPGVGPSRPALTIPPAAPVFDHLPEALPPAPGNVRARLGNPSVF
ncbi:MAG TPA: efflux transporter outer membrane subunit [Gemmataceae bacterium]|nr:efflux transporter outer membrane subunit [Gemmataceae bacterium]